MKILYVITGLGLGGAEKVVCDLADQMSGKGHEVKIAYLTGDKVISPKSPNIEIIYLGLNGINSFIFASLKYRQLLKKFRPDIVHAHMVHANIFTRLNRIINHIPKLICTAHNSNEGGKLRMLAYHYTNFLSDKNTNVSKEATQSLINRGAFNQNNVITVYNGIDIDKFSKVSGYKQDRESIRFISIGRFNEQKDYPNLLNAITKISSKKNLSFDIVGDGELRPLIEDLILSLDIGDKVKLLGRRSDIPNLLNNSDFFVLPSAYEGFGLVVAEAMACGAFVIATNSGGVAEVMGDTGLLVPPQDSQALTQAMQQVLSLTDEQISSNNIRARKRIEELFSLEKSVEKWLEIYEAK